jgi:hypothetical protein
MRERVRIQPYVPRELAARLRAYSAAKGVPDGAVIQSALNEYLDRVPPCDTPAREGAHAASTFMSPDGFRRAAWA